MNREPNTLDAAAECATTIAEMGAWTIIVVCLFFLWIGTPA